MHNEDAIDDDDLAEQSDPPLTRSREQSLQVPVPATPLVLPAISTPSRPEPLPPPVSIFDQPKFSDMTESQLVIAFLNNNVVFVLPSQYCPPTFEPPEAEMIVIGTRVQRLSKMKSALWVHFLSATKIQSFNYFHAAWNLLKDQDRDKILA